MGNIIQITNPYSSLCLAVYGPLKASKVKLGEFRLSLNDIFSTIESRVRFDNELFGVIMPFSQFELRPITHYNEFLGFHVLMFSGFFLTQKKVQKKVKWKLFL